MSGADLAANEVIRTPETKFVFSFCTGNRGRWGQHPPKAAFRTLHYAQETTGAGILTSSSMTPILDQNHHRR